MKKYPYTYITDFLFLHILSVLSVHCHQSLGPNKMKNKNNMTWLHKRNPCFFLMSSLFSTLNASFSVLPLSTVFCLTQTCTTHPAEWQCTAVWPSELQCWVPWERRRLPHCRKGGSRLCRRYTPAQTPSLCYFGSGTRCPPRQLAPGTCSALVFETSLAWSPLRLCCLKAKKASNYL